MNRLEDMLSYARAKGCRQGYLISYFGENADDWECGVCDHCSDAVHSADRDLTPAELATVHTILSSVRIFNGRIGRGRLSQILAGVMSADTVNSKYTDSVCFGILKPMKQNLIMQYLRELEDKGYLERCGNPEYPCLGLSTQGRIQIEARRDIRLNLPVPKKKAPAIKISLTPPTENDDGDQKLLARLKALRAKLAAKRGVPSYVVFGDKTLLEFARLKPVTPADTEGITGVGPAKMATYVPVFIKEIAAFLEEEGK